MVNIELLKKLVNQPNFIYLLNTLNQNKLEIKKSPIQLFNIYSNLTKRLNISLDDFQILMQNSEQFINFYKSYSVYLETLDASEFDLEDEDEDEDEDEELYDSYIIPYMIHYIAFINSKNLLKKYFKDTGIKNIEQHLENINNIYIKSIS